MYSVCLCYNVGPTVMHNELNYDLNPKPIMLIFSITLACECVKVSAAGLYARK